MADFRTALEILLRAKDETKAATTSAGANLGSLSSHITAVSTAFLAARQAAQDALGIVDAVIGGAVREADAFDSLSQRIGVSASRLSELKFAGDVAGVSFETISRTLETLTRRIGDIAIKGDAEASPALARLGIRLEEIVNLQADEQLTLILERLGDVANASERAAIATALFGRSGTEIVELSGRVDELTAASHRAGAAMSEEFIKKAAEARERFKEFEASVKGVRNELAEQILMQIDDEDLDKALASVRELAAFAGRTISIIIDVATSDDLTRLREQLSNIFGGPTRLQFEVDAAGRAAVVDEAGNIAEDAQAEFSRIFGDWKEILLTDIREISGIVIEGAGAIEAAEDQLLAAGTAARTLALNTDDAAAAAARTDEHVRDVLASLEATADATDRQLVATLSVAGHWDEISRAAALALKTQADVTAELEDMLEAGLSMDEAWDRINAQLGVSTTRTLELVGALEQVTPAVEAIRHEFDFFSASNEEMAARLAVSLEQQTDQLGETVTSMIGGTLDQLAGMWASNIVFGRKWSETLLQIVKQLVADILAELAKLAAKKFALGFLNLVLPGAGSVLDFTETLGRTQQQRGEGALDVPAPIVEPPEITFREPEPITFPAMEIALPQPEVIPPEVRFIPAAPVEFPAVDVAVPAPVILPPQIRIVQPEDFIIPPIDLDVPAPTIIGPQIRFVEPAALVIPPIDVTVPMPTVEPPEVVFAEQDPIVIPPIEVRIPRPQIVMPEVIFQTEPMPPPPPVIIPAPRSPITSPAEIVPTQMRNMTFNISVNTMFGSRAAGLDAARAMLPFLREVGTF